MSDSEKKKRAFEKRIDVLSPCFDQLAEAIKIRYHSVVEHQRHNPVPAQLSAIIETAFAASLRSEEQRPVQFQLVCGHPDHSTRWGKQEAGHDQDWDFGFISNIELTAENIRKLSPALDHESSGILVWDGDSKPVIRGIVRFKKTGTPRRPHGLSSIFTTERAVRITATSPGTLVFDSCEYLLGELVDGTLTFPQAIEVFTRNFGTFKNSILGFANIAFEALPEYLRSNDNPHAQTEWSELFTSTLLGIVHAMRRTRCGGTLIITDISDISGCIENVGFALSSWPGSGTDGMPTVAMRMQHYFRTLLEAEHSELVKGYGESSANTALSFASGKFEAVYREHAELMRAARFVGQLTATDGAVILKPDLSVWAIGAKLKTGNSPKRRHVTNAAATQLTNRDIEQADLEEYVNPRGMRFKSAISNAVSDPQALIFLASEDGPVAVVEGSNNEVLIGEPLSFAPITLW